MRGLLPLALAMVFCACPPAPAIPVPEQPPAPDAGLQCLSVFPEVVEFGEIDSFTGAFTRVRLTNLNRAPVTLNIPPLNAPFSIRTTGELMLQASSSVLLEVHFQPEDGLLHFGDFEVTGVPGCVTRVPVRGLGSGSVMLNPERLDFGVVAPGQQKALELRFTNTRRTPVTFDGLTLMDASPGGGAAFDLDSGALTRLELPPSSTTTLPVTASPPSFGRFAAKLTAVGPAGLVDIPLSVTGGATVAQLVPTAVQVPSVGFWPGSFPPSFVERVVRLKNLSTDHSGFSGLVLVPPGFLVEEAGGSFGSELQVTTPDQAVFSGIAPGGEALVVLRFSPSSLGPRTFRVTFFTNDPGPLEQVVTFEATARTLPFCSLQRIPAGALELSPGPDGGSFGEAIFRNVGNTTCVLDDLRLEPQTDPGFALTDGGVIQLELLPGQAHVVTFSGPDAGPFPRATALGFHLFNPNSGREFLEVRVP